MKIFLGSLLIIMSLCAWYESTCVDYWKESYYDQTCWRMIDHYNMRNAMAGRVSYVDFTIMGFSEAVQACQVKYPELKSK